MRSTLKTFWTDTSGAVTVDWVVLTAVIVVFAGAAGLAVSEGTIEVGDALQANLEARAE